MTIWPFRHIALKVWSVVLAVLLWMVVAGEETVERGLRVPLELQQFPAGLELQADAPSLVDVRVRGSSGTLSRVAPGEIVAMLDLRTARPGRRLFQVTPEQVRVPSGVEVVQVAPSSIALSFENSATRQVPIAPALEGNPASGFTVGSMTTEPKMAEIAGPESAVARLTEATTEPVSVERAREDVIESVTVGVLDPAVRVKTPGVARVTVHVVPGPIERALSDQAIHFRGVASGLRAESDPGRIEIVFRGNRARLDHLDASAITAFVDVSGLGAGVYMLGVRVDPTQGISVSRINPAPVPVRIANSQR
jgi:YbbR domain-containing protein